MRRFDCWFWLAALGAGVMARAGQDVVPADAWRRQVEADWIRREELLAGTNRAAVITTAMDALGGCDGIKDGGYGFHTGQAEDPWWQVDLGASRPLARVVIWNRADNEDASRRATNLAVRVSHDGREWREVYRHGGGLFRGVPDRKPLQVELGGGDARHVRVQLGGSRFLHLDEVEVYGSEEPTRNLALGAAADQCSTSQWSVDHRPLPPVDWRIRTKAALEACRRLLREGREGEGTDGGREAMAGAIERVEASLARLDAGGDGRGLFLEARWILRPLLLGDPLLDFEALLITKRRPATFNHMSDQYYGWWSQPGGGLYLLRGFRSATPSAECISGVLGDGGSFLRPTLSYDGRRVLFAWCRHYPHLAGEPNKLDKANVPEDAFYHLFEMGIDGTGLRQLTRGKYDDFDGRYLPDGRIVFLSTRRGQSVQVTGRTAAATVERPDLPDIYVRCGGDASRPVAVYTLHTMDPDGGDIRAISPFEMFEWTPEIAHDGSILHSRWDYVDRDNMPYMGLWAINPDGTNPRIVFGNYTRSPHCVFEPVPVPGSRKIVFTASAHHSQTMGSLVLFDPDAGQEGATPLKRLTPEVPFPEIEAWPATSYADPWPLSERQYVVAWGDEGARVPGPAGWDRWHAVRRPDNGMGIYYYDAEMGLELLYRDPAIACYEPIPVRSRHPAPVLAERGNRRGADEGRFLLLDVYEGLPGVARGEIRALRLVTVPPKTHPVMNRPNMGLTDDDPGKCVLGTVPVEEDGSAHFRVPSGVILFFQALDARGMAVQTMRTVTHVQAGETLTCVGCHEPRELAPRVRGVMAARREPSRIVPGPDGSWPLRFDRLVQPVLDRRCVRCHQPGGEDARAVDFVLTPDKAYESLVGFGEPSLRSLVKKAYADGRSIPGGGVAQRSRLLGVLGDAAHRDVELAVDERERLTTWMDTYAQRLGAFSPEQEQQLVRLREEMGPMLEAAR
ncbi:MAG TPA: discoidin domain-containing protein [Verrucomicrobiota bacterium]|nr:discoidin domain-containing protein [Verrucomicrobiota bacterium]HNU51792.1 discoidin domain-containing protein [Verrucomicrobiota bacterium]